MTRRRDAKTASPPSGAAHCQTPAKSAKGGRSVSLPILAAHGPVRASKNGKRRAIVLIVVHVLMAIHIVQWLIVGRTLSPVEPSEAMYTLNRGEVNAGFIFFLAAIAVTMIFGRFVCGWGCHFIAYQDLCAWILKKLHIKPKPFRARFLVLAPLALALYMFVWPTAYREIAILLGVEGAARPKFENHLMTAEFWATFPSIPVAIVSVLIAGFSIVYFLGAKGFCTYACPYGGFFGVAERVSPVRIRVTDDCEHCGHCTSVCTSNVRVHEEVALYGMVVDPGCMKCMDCVSVCPNDALYVGFGAPALGAKPAKPVKVRRYSFGLGEEIAMLVVGLGTFLACRGLYDVFPMLMTMGLSAMVGWMLVTAWRTAFGSNAKVQGTQLALGGRTTRAGKAFVAISACVLLFVVHAGWIKVHTKVGNHLLATAGVRHDSWQLNKAEFAVADESRKADLQQAVAWFERADAVAVAVKVELVEGMVSAYHLQDRVEDAEAAARRIARRHPEYPQGRYLLGSSLARLGRREEAIAEFRAALDRQPSHHLARRELLIELTAAGRRDEIRTLLLDVLERAPDHADLLADVGRELADAGWYAEAVPAFRRSLAVHPHKPDARLGLRHALVQSGQVDAAYAMYREEMAAQPADGRLVIELAELMFAQGRFAEAEAEARRALSLDAGTPGAVRVLAFALAAQERIPEAMTVFRERVQAAPDDVDLRAEFTQFLLQLGAYDLAAPQAAVVAEKRPGQAIGHLLAADAYLGLQRWPEAVTALRQGIALAPTSPEPHFSLAFALYHTGDFQAAEASVREAIRLSPADPAYRDLLVQILVAMGRNDEAAKEAPPAPPRP
jgi:tetratricopeptide (TPR) repeat protein/NAD-dependent dihydropyrimidine dehydrogenase PreA subunit